MRKFWVIWTYIGNHCEKPWTRHGDSAEEVLEEVLNGFSEDFRKRGKVYVFDKEPIVTHSQLNDKQRG